MWPTATIYFQEGILTRKLAPCSSLPVSSMLSISPPWVVLLAITASLLLAYRKLRNARLPYPPGPRGYPVIGNVFDIPQDVPLWKAAVPMGETYSERFAHTACLQTDIGILRNRRALPERIGRRSDHIELQPSNLRLARQTLCNLFGSSACHLNSSYFSVVTQLFNSQPRSPMIEL